MIPFRILFIVLIINYTAVNLRAEDNAITENRISYDYAIRRSAADKNSIQKPAAFQITLPENGKNSYAVDFGLSLILSSLPPQKDWFKWELDASSELHKNTLTVKPQDSLISGFTAMGVIGNVATHKSSLLPQIYLKHKRDRIASNNSILSGADFSAAVPFIGIGFILGPKNFGYTWQPNVGIELENIIKAEKDKPTGHVARVKADLEAAIFPFREIFDSRLEIYGAFRNWWDFSKSEGIDGEREYHYLISVVPKYYLDNHRMFSIGMSYINGDNPTEGLKKQKYIQVAFMVRK